MVNRNSNETQTTEIKNNNEAAAENAQSGQKNPPQSEAAAETTGSADTQVEEAAAETEAKPVTLVTELKAYVTLLSSKLDKLNGTGNRVQQFVVDNESKFRNVGSITKGYGSLKTASDDLKTLTDPAKLDRIESNLREALAEIAKKEGIDLDA